MKTDTPNPSPAARPAKAHYPVLDGLRGVAAVMVVLYHAFEIHGWDNGAGRYAYFLHHSYLAVDFFFLLSGYVIAYAYDDRAEQMGVWGFFRRRLIRLHPMVIIATLLGAVVLPFHACGFFPAIADLTWTKYLIGVVMGMLLLPVLPGWDTRGNTEMFPLNGPAWSLFFEYIANLFYILLLRRLPKVLLAVLTAAAACLTLHHLLLSGNGDIIGGWSAACPSEIYIGFVRLAFPFMMGMLLARAVPVRPIRHAFPICAAILVALFVVPRLGPAEKPWVNGLYEAACILIAFPTVVWLGACGTLKRAAETQVCTFLGNVSYPLYIIHYPIMYGYMTAVCRYGLTPATGWPYALSAAALSLVTGWLVWRFYDVPVRRWLTSRGRA